MKHAKNVLHQCLAEASNTGIARALICYSSQRQCSLFFFISVCKICTRVLLRVKILDRVPSGANFLTAGVFKCDIAHRQFVAVLCMLYKSRCNRMHHIHGALPGQNVPECVTRFSHISTLIQLLAAHQPSTAGIFFPCQHLCGTILATRIIWCATDGFQGPGQCLFYPFYGLVLLGGGLPTDRV